MMNYGNFGGFFNPGNFWGWFGAMLFPVMLWSLFWKGWALWRASKNDAKVWFAILLVVNTVGILDILYLFVFGKVSRKKSR